MKTQIIADLEKAGKFQFILKDGKIADIKANIQHMDFGTLPHSAVSGIICNDLELLSTEDEVTGTIKVYDNLKFSDKVVAAKGFAPLFKITKQLVATKKGKILQDMKERINYGCITDKAPVQEKPTINLLAS